jgi:transcription elongation factor Elf1
MDHEYWFGVELTFACPVCQHLNVEKIGLNSPTADPSNLNQKINSQVLACRKCRALPMGAQVAVDVVPGTRESLIAKGFPFPPDK